MTDVYEFSEFNRNDLVYNYATVTTAEAIDIREKTAAFEKEQAAKKAAAAAEAAKAKAAQAAGTPAPAAPTPAPVKPTSDKPS